MSMAVWGNMGKGVGVAIDVFEHGSRYKMIWVIIIVIVILICLIIIIIIVIIIIIL